MKHIFPFIIFAAFVIAVYFIIEQIRKKELKYTENRLFTIFCLCSAIWSFGFCGVFLQTDTSVAYIWRAIGMVGTFGYLITVTLLICKLPDIPKAIRYPVEAFSYLGAVLYFPVIAPENAVYQMSSIGMTYSLTSGLANTLYVAYCGVLAIGMLFIVFYMIFRSKSLRIKTLGKKLLITEMIVIAGMLLDTIFPILGFEAIPGSTIAQFIGLVVMNNTISFINHSRITVNNTSEHIYYSLSVPVLVYDKNHKLHIMNDNAYSFLGMDKEHFTDIGLDTLFRIEQNDIFTFEGNSNDVDAQCVNNNAYCNLSINKICDNYGDVIGYIVIVTDLSERLKYVKILEDAKKEAEQANNAKSVFLANMSHEIRTPMNAIVGFSELVLTMDIDDAVRSHVEDIKWSSHNLLAIINDILDFSKIESGKTELVDDTYYTATFLHDISMIIAPQAEKNDLTFKMNVDHDIPTALYGDKTRIRGVLINILNNAIKYTKEGCVSFDISIKKRTDSHITLEFKIQDTGIGIKEEDLNSLFDSFERFDQKLNHDIEGSGLGLAIANKYVNLMGGHIDVESVYTKGTTFTVTLGQKIMDPPPFGDDYKLQNASSTSGSISNMKISNTRVLVTDDNLINLRVADGIFSHYGLTVDTASSALEAIDKCTAFEYDIVFMDHMMPEIDGVEAMKRLRKLNNHYNTEGECKIIVLTANAIKGTRELLINEGFDDYLGKPINIPNLERLFKKYIPENKISYDNDISEHSTSVDTTSERADYNFLKSVLPNLDIDSGISNCGSSLKEYLKILKITYDYGPKQIAELKAALDTKDYATYIIKIHSLKSTTLNIGAINLSSKARNQEEEGHKGNYDYIDEHFEDFYNGYNRLIDNLKTALEHFGMINNAPAEDTSVLSNEIITRALKTIDTHIDNFDFGRVFAILEEIHKCQLPDEFKGLFDRISTLMDELDVDEIKEIIKDYI